MDYPLEIWREISLHFPVNFLAVNSKLIAIYDESWFKDKLNLTCSEYKKHDNSYEYLYRRLCKSGNIHMLDGCGVVEKLPIKGIKLSKTLRYNFAYFVLSFDGDLFCYEKNKLIAIDCNVEDINEICYLKNNEWYMIKDNNTIEIASNDTKWFLSKSCEIPLYSIITKNKINFVCDESTYSYQPEFEIKDCRCDNGILVLEDTNNHPYRFKLLYDIFHIVQKRTYLNVRLNNGIIAIIKYHLPSTNYKFTIDDKLCSLSKDSYNLFKSIRESSSIFMTDYIIV